MEEEEDQRKWLRGMLTWRGVIVSVAANVKESLDVVVSCNTAQFNCTVMSRRADQWERRHWIAWDLSLVGYCVQAGWRRN